MGSSLGGNGIPSDPTQLPVASWDDLHAMYAPLDDPFMQQFLMQQETQWSPGTLQLMSEMAVPWAYGWEQGMLGGEYGDPV